MISIILYQPETSGNVGAVARAMKNFDLKNLVLVGPKCKLDQDAKNRAKHAQDVLKKAKVVDEKALDKFDYLIATTAKLGSDYNLPRLPLNPSQLALKIKAKQKKAKIGILFGPEGKGLSNEMILKSDFIVNIPAGKYGVLNLSHAVTVICYELFKANVKKEEKYKPASAKEKQEFMKQLDAVLARIDFETEHKRKNMRTVWQRLVGKSMLTKRELFALFGFLKKIK